MAEAPGLPPGLHRSRVPLTRPEVYPAHGPTSSKTNPAAKAGVICSGTPPRFLSKEENAMQTTTETVRSDALHVVEPRAAGLDVHKL